MSKWCVWAICLAVSCSALVGCTSHTGEPDLDPNLAPNFGTAEEAAIEYIEALSVGDAERLTSVMRVELSNSEIASARKNVFGTDVDVEIIKISAGTEPDWTSMPEMMVSCYVKTSGDLPIADNSGLLFVPIVAEEDNGQWFVKYAPIRQE